MGGAVRATKAVYFVGFRAAALRSPAGAMEEEVAAANKPRDSASLAAKPYTARNNQEISRNGMITTTAATVIGIKILLPVLSTPIEIDHCLQHDIRLNKSS